MEFYKVTLNGKEYGLPIVEIKPGLSIAVLDMLSSKALSHDASYAVIEKIKELDRDDEKYLQMLRQPILKDPTLPERMDEELGKYINHIFEQPLDKAYRRCRVYYPKWHDEYLATAIEPTRGYKLKQKIKKMLKSK